MSMRMILITLAIWPMLGLAGCQRVTYRANTAKGIYAGTLNAPVAAKYSSRRTVHFLFWGLWLIGEADLDQIAGPALKPGQALADIVVLERNSIVDGLLAFVTYGLYRPRSVIVTGKIYDLKGATP